MLDIVARVLLFASLGGLCGCTVFLALVLVSAARFRALKKRPLGQVGKYPPATLLKPLCGLEARLEANLESFFRQDYPRFEIVFGVRDKYDPALAVVHRISRRYPDVPIAIVLSGEPDRPNAKVCSLQKMVAAAKSDYLVISDSDVHVNPNYLKEVVRPLLDPQVGLVTCLYRGVPSGGIWSRLEALGMSVEMTSGVLVADLLEGMKFALGPTMAIRRDVLDAVGGMGVLADYCADDYVLGKKVAEIGRTVVLSFHVIDHVVINDNWKPSILHQVRWMRSTRFSRPAGHIGSGLTFAMPFGLLGFVAGVALHHGAWAAALLGAALVNRVVMSIVTGWGVVGDDLALRDCWLYPVRDLMGFCFWIASFLGTTIVWRNQRYRLEKEGRMVLLANPSASDSRTVAVDSLA
jgi:ceramide glucosyltransferase